MKFLGRGQAILLIGANSNFGILFLQELHFHWLFTFRLDQREILRDSLR